MKKLKRYFLNNIEKNIYTQLAVYYNKWFIKRAWTFKAETYRSQRFKIIKYTN
jgi:hypothetical protein